MTEEDWRECSEPLELLSVAQPGWAEERLRQYSVFVLGAIGANRAADLLAAHATFAGHEEEIERYRREAAGPAGRMSGGGYSMGRKPVHLSPSTQRARAILAALQPHALASAREVTRETQHLVRREQCEVLRCLFPNPFRPVAFSSSWRSETVVALASAIYAERAFDRMPILADALEEAGCDHADVLSHCRGPGPHVRGCWAVDGVLGKE
jgi:hypothetical protein